MPGRGSAGTSGGDGSDGQDARSTADVIASLVVNTQAMIAKEVELLGHELKGLAARKLTAIALLLVGALALASVVLLGAMTAAIALEDTFDERWMAWGAVTLGLAVVALLLVIIATRLLMRRWSPRARRRDATTTVTWLRGLTDEVSNGSDDAQGRA